MAAVERGAPPEDCVRAAAGIYLRDRRSVVEALLRLLRSRSEPEDHPFAAVAASPRGATLKRDVDAFGAGLLAIPEDASSSSSNASASAGLLARLADILAAPAPGTAPTPAPYVVETPGGRSLTPGGGAADGSSNDAARAADPTDPFAAARALELVADERGRPCRRADWLAHERKLVAECLYHATLASDASKGGRGVRPADAAKLATLFGEFAAPALGAATADAEARLALEDAFHVAKATRAHWDAKRRNAMKTMHGGYGAYGGEGEGTYGGDARFARNTRGGFSYGGGGGSGGGARGGPLETPHPGGVSHLGGGFGFGFPPLAPRPELPREVAEDLPAATAVFFAVLAAATPSPGGSADGDRASVVGEAAMRKDAVAALEQPLDAALRAADEAAEAAREALDAHDHAGSGDAGVFFAAAARRPAAGAAAAAGLGFAGPPPGASSGEFGLGLVGGLSSPYGGVPAYGGLGGGLGGSAFDSSDGERDARREDLATRLATRRVVEAARLARALAALDAEVGDGGGGVAASESVRERCEASVVSASDGGALTALRSALQTVSFQDDDDASRRSYLDLAHAVALRAVRAMLERPALGEALAAVEIPMTRAQVEREERLAMLERAMDAEAEAEAGRRAEAADAARSSRARNDASGGGAGFYYEYDDDRYDGAPRDRGAYGGDDDDPYGGGYPGDDQRRRRAEEERARVVALKEEEDALREPPLRALCLVFSEIYRQAPDAPFSDAVGGLLPDLLDALVVWEHGVDTLVATLQLLARIAASGEEGARAAWARMSDPPRDASVGWDHLVAALVGYDRKFAEDDRVKRQGQAAHAGGGAGANAIEFGVNAYGAGGDFGGGPGGGHRLASNAATNPGGSSDAPFEPLPEADARGLEAYLRAVSSVVSGAAPAETRRLVAWFDARCGGVSFLDLLARTRSRPEVPAPVKAAVLDVFAAVGGSSATAAEEAWARLEAANEETTFSRGFFSGGGASSGASSFGAHSSGYLGGVSGGYYHHPGGMTHSSPAGGGSVSSYGAAAMARQTDAYLQSREDARRRETAARETASLERFRGGAVDASLVRELGGAEYTSSFVGDESLGGSLADGFGGSSAGAEHFVDANDAVPRAYPHAASYVRLVNGLLAATAGSGAGPARDAGGASAAPFRFVRDDVFGRLATRPHASQTERWSMARDAITHFRLHLEIFAAEGFQAAAFRSTDRDGSTMGGGGAVVPGGSVPGGRVPPPGGTRPPGLDLMIDFLTDGPTIRGVLALLSVGADRLAAERTHAHGEALEGAVLAALDLVVDALALDVACAERLKDEFASSGGAEGTSAPVFAETLDAALIRDGDQLAAVLGYTRYRFNPALPLASLRVLSALAERVERLVDLLAPAAAERLVEGVASCLELAVKPGGGPGGGGFDGSIGRFEPGGGGGGDLGSSLRGPGASVAEAGAAALDLLLDALPRRAPNLAHLLLGFDVRGDVERDSRLAPFESFNCFSVLLELLEAAPPSLMARAGPGGGDAETRRGDSSGLSGGSSADAAEAAARVVFELVSDPTTGPATAAALREWPPGAPWEEQRLPLLVADALGAGFSDAPGVSVSSDARSKLDESNGSRWGRGSPAALHHRAWLLRAAAATLDASAPPPGSARVSSLDDLPPVCAALARAALRRADDREEGSHPLAALELLATLPPVPPPPLRAALATMTTTTTVSFGGDPNPSRPDANDPNASHHVSDDVLRELGVAELLADRRPVADGGCFEVTSRGDAVVSMRAFGAKLLDASRRVVAASGEGGAGAEGRGGGGGGGGGGAGSSSTNTRSEVKAAVTRAVRAARAFNSAVESHAARAHLVGAWSTFVASVASRCLPDAGAESTAPEDDPREALYSLADGALRALADETDASGTLAGFFFPASSSSSSAFAARHLSLGAPPGWRAASDAPLARVAATLLETLRAASGGGGVGYHGFAFPGSSASSLAGLGPVFFDVDASSSASSDAYASPAGGGDPGAGVAAAVARAMGRGTEGAPPLPPSKCKALLRALVAAVSRGTRADQSRGDRSRRFAAGGGGVGGGGGGAYPGLGAVRFDEETCLDAASRANLYAALVSLLRYARPASGPNPARVPASVLALAEDAANTFAAETGPGTSDGSPGDRGEGSAQGARAEASAFGSAFGRGTGTGGGVPGSGIDGSPRRGGSEANPSPFGGEGESSAAARFAREASAAASAAARARDELDAGAAATLRRDASGLVALLARDVVDAGSSDARRAVALEAIEALVDVAASDAGGGGDAGEGAREGGGGGVEGGDRRASSGFGAFGEGGSGAAGYRDDGIPSRSLASTPAGALGAAIADAGVVRACLETIERLALTDVILPTERARDALASARAALSLMLRLARLPEGGAAAVFASGAMHALTSCRALDAYAAEPTGDAAASAASAAVRAERTRRGVSSGRRVSSAFLIDAEMSSERRTFDALGDSSSVAMDADGDAGDPGGRASGSFAWDVLDSLPAAEAAAAAAASPVAPAPLARARHHALLVPALRLAGVLVNALADDPRAFAAGCAFANAHANVLVRALSDRSRKAHLCDLAEAEAAAGLVARLIVRESGVATTQTGATDTNTAVLSNRPPGGVPRTSDLGPQAPRLDPSLAPALMSLTRSLCAGDGKYDQFVACASPRGSPAYSTPAAAVNRSVAFAAEGASVAVGGLAPAVAAVVAMRVERGVRATRAALCSAQLALAEKGGAGGAYFPARESPGGLLEGGGGTRTRAPEGGGGAAECPGGFIPGGGGSLGGPLPFVGPSLATFASLAARCAEELREEQRARLALLRELDADGARGASSAVAREARCGAAGGGAAGASAEFAAAAEALGADAFARGGSTADPSFFGGGERFGAARPAGLSLFGEDPGRGEGRAAAAAAAVGARERGARALIVTVEASLELVLGQLARNARRERSSLGDALFGSFGVSSDPFGSANAYGGAKSRLPGGGYRPSAEEIATSASETPAYTAAEVADLCATLAPAVATLASLDHEAGRERVGRRPGRGFLAGLGPDNGRLRALVRRARDQLLAARGADPGGGADEGAPALLLAGGAAGAGAGAGAGGGGDEGFFYR